MKVDSIDHKTFQSFFLSSRVLKCRIVFLGCCAPMTPFSLENDSICARSFPFIIYERPLNHPNVFSVSFYSASLYCVCLMFYAFRWTVFLCLCFFFVSFQFLIVPCVYLWIFKVSFFCFFLSFLSFLFLFYVVLFFALRYVTRQLSLIGFLCCLRERHIETFCYVWVGLRATCRNSVWIFNSNRDESFLDEKKLWN